VRSPEDRGYGRHPMASVLTEPARTVGTPPTPPQRRRWAVAVLGAVAVVGAAVGIVVASGGSPVGAPPSRLGVTENRAVPASVLDIPLVNQNDQTTSLGAFRGKIVVLASFLTSCQETCPLTTGAFLDMQRAVDRAGLRRQVVFLEASVDPGRDVPARLAAYARVTGPDWPLLTGTPAHLAQLWHYFGVFYQKVPEDNPPGIDWQTGKPYTYDVNHSDGFIVFDRRLRERFVTGAAPNVRKLRLEASLQAMLDGQGLREYSHPARDAWTVPEGLQAVGWVAGRAIAPVN